MVIDVNTSTFCKSSVDKEISRILEWMHLFPILGAYNKKQRIGSSGCRYNKNINLWKALKRHRKGWGR